MTTGDRFGHIELGESVCRRRAVIFEPAKIPLSRLLYIIAFANVPLQGHCLSLSVTMGKYD